MSQSGPYLVVGLGNPGDDYAATRHNAGRMVLDLLGGRLGGRFKAHARGRAHVLEGRIAGPGSPRVVLAAPRSYMNESGGPVASLVASYGIDPQNVVAIHDELDIEFGALRLKRGGGDGGHNGLKSMRASLGTGDFLRVRVGIGRPPGRQDPADFVLKPFGAAQRKELDVNLEVAADAVELLVREGLEKAQNAFNS